MSFVEINTKFAQRLIPAGLAEYADLVAAAQAQLEDEEAARPSFDVAAQKCARH
jgi:hypothetical protein